MLTPSNKLLGITSWELWRNLCKTGIIFFMCLIEFPGEASGLWVFFVGKILSTNLISLAVQTVPTSVCEWTWLACACLVWVVGDVFTVPSDPLYLIVDCVVSSFLRLISLEACQRQDTFVLSKNRHLVLGFIFSVIFIFGFISPTAIVISFWLRWNWQRPVCVSVSYDERRYLDLKLFVFSIDIL